MVKAEGEETKKKKKFRKLIVEEEMEIVRIVEEKKKEEKDLIEIRTIKKMVSRRFYKYLKMFEKKNFEKIPIRKL